MPRSSLSPPPRAVFLTGLLLALATTPGCRCNDAANPAAKAPTPAPVPALGEISVTDVTSPEERPPHTQIDTAAIETAAKGALAGAGLFRASSATVSSPGESTTPGQDEAPRDVRARVRIEIGVEDVVAGDKAAARAGVRLRIDTRPSEISAAHWNEDVEGRAETVYDPTDTKDRAALFGKLVTRTVTDLIAGYVARQRLWTDDGSGARAALKGDAGESRLEAIHVIGERRLSGAAPELLALLEDSDESVRDAALGALVELRERKAVGVLASQRSMRDRREMRKILDAISVLGGPEASDYLGFVADGHDDPEIRTMATEARARLLRREDAGRK